MDLFYLKRNTTRKRGRTLCAPTATLPPPFCPTANTSHVPLDYKVCKDRDCICSVLHCLEQSLKDPGRLVGASIREIPRGVNAGKGTEHGGASGLMAGLKPALSTYPNYTLTGMTSAPGGSLLGTC